MVAAAAARGATNEIKRRTPTVRPARSTLISFFLSRVREESFIFFYCDDPFSTTLFRSAARLSLRICKKGKLRAAVRLLCQVVPELETELNFIESFQIPCSWLYRRGGKILDTL